MSFFTLCSCVFIIINSVRYVYILTVESVFVIRIRVKIVCIYYSECQHVSRFDGVIFIRMAFKKVVD